MAKKVTTVNHFSKLECEQNEPESEYMSSAIPENVPSRDLDIDDLAGWATTPEAEQAVTVASEGGVFENDYFLLATLLLEDDGE